MEQADNNSRRKLYDALSQTYNLGSFDEFNTKMDSPESRQKLYNAVSGTHNLGSFADFERKIGSEQPASTPQQPVNTAPQSTQPAQQRQVAKPSVGMPQWKTSAMPEEVQERFERQEKQPAERAGMPGDKGVFAEPFDFSSKPQEEINKRATREEVEKVVPKVYAPEVRSQYVDKLVEEYSPELGSATDWKRRQEDAKKAQREHVAEQVDNMLGDVENMRTERLKELGRDYQSKGQRSVFDIYNIANTPGTVRSTTANPDQQAAMNDEQLGMMTAAERKLKGLQKTVEEAQRHADDPNWFAEFGRGMGAGLSDVSTWDFGITDLADAKKIQRALEKYDRISEVDANGGTTDEVMTPAEQALLDAVAAEVVVNEYYGSDLSNWYKGGQSTAVSIPFMASMIVSPAMAAGRGASAAMARYITKRFAQTAAKKGIQKVASKVAQGAFKASSRVAIDAGAAALHTAMFSPASIEADTRERMRGQITPTYDVEGNVRYGGRIGGDSEAEARRKAAINAFIENESEMLGDYIPGMKVIFGNAKWAKRFMSNRFVNNIARMERRAQFHGFLPEVLEEIAGGAMNAAWVGDQTFDADPETGVFSKDNLSTIAISIGATTLAMGCAKLGGYAASRAMLSATNKEASQLFGDEWNDIRERLQSEDMNEVSAAAEEIRTSDNYTEEQKKAAIKYATLYTGLNAYEHLTADDMDIDAKNANDTYRSAYEDATSDEIRHDITIMMDESREKVRQTLGDEILSMLEEEDPLTVKQTLEEKQQLTDEQAAALADYVAAHSAVAGVKQRIEDDADAMVERERDAFNLQRNDEDGALHPATMTVDGEEREVYIKSGNVVLDASGAIDVANSGETIVVYDPVDGKNVMVSPKDLGSVGEVVTAEQYEAGMQSQREAYVQQQQDSATGRFNPQPGQQIEIPEAGMATVLATDGESVTLQMPDGSQQSMAIADIQSIVDAMSMEDYRQRHPEAAAPEAAAEVQPGGLREGAPEAFEPDMDVLINEEGQDKVLRYIGRARLVDAKGKVYEPDEEGSFLAFYDPTAVDQARYVNTKYKEEYDAFLQKVVGYKPAEQQEAEQPAEPAAAVEPEEAPVEEQPGESVQQEEEAAPAGESAEAAAASASEVNPMPMKTVGTGKNKHEEEDWYATTPERAYQYLYEEAVGLGLPVETADNMVATNLKKAQQAVERAKTATGSVVSVLQKQNSAQADVDYWRQVAAMRQAVVDAEKAEAAAQRRAELEEQQRKDAERHDAAVAQQQADYEARKQAEAEREAVGKENPMPQITEKWNNAEKVDGFKDELVLPNGESVKGHYVLHESGASSPSHNSETWKPTEGFPMDVNNGTVNDRDYERSEKAQEYTRQMAANFDQRALQTPVFVSADGVVLSGNGRTMAGEIAARNNSDGVYINYLREYAHKYGFTPEQVDAMQHPRVSFVPDARMPYTVDTFAKFNGKDTKSQDDAEEAIKLGKLVSDDTYGRIVNIIRGYDTLGEFYNDPKATAPILREFINNGIITEAELAKMETGPAGNKKLSVQGRDILENALTGKIFASNPDVVKMLVEMPAVKQKIVAALAELADNAALGEKYALNDILTDAVKLVYDAKVNFGVKDGDIVSVHSKQYEMFKDPDQMETAADVQNGAMLMLADMLNGKGVNNIKERIELYNDEARQAAAGQIDLFGGGQPRSREEMLKDVINSYNNATRKQREAARAAAVERRKGASSNEADTADESRPESQGEGAGEREAEPAGAAGGAVEQYREGESLKEYTDRNGDYPSVREQYMRQKYGERYDEMAEVVSNITRENAREKGRQIGAMLQTDGNGLDEAQALLSIFNVGAAPTMPFFDGVTDAAADKQKVDELAAQLDDHNSAKNDRLIQQIADLNTEASERWLDENVRSQKAGSTLQKPTKEEKNLVRSLVSLLNKLGIKSHLNVRESQKVLDKYRELAKLLRVWHGSGADFDRFDHSHMGEGEGAQAYGYGTYVTEVEGIGKRYAEKAYEKNNGIQVYHDGSRIDQNEVYADPYVPENYAANLLFEQGDVDAAIERLNQSIGLVENLLQNTNRPSLRELYESDLNRYRETIELLQDGKWQIDDSGKRRILYEVEIPDDNGSNYLEWDKVYSYKELEEIYNRLPEDIRKQFGTGDFEGWGINREDFSDDKYVTGEHIYKVLSGQDYSIDGEGINKQNASAALHAAGFTGIKYPAQFMTGGRSDNAKNYVIFDENDLKIVDKIRFHKAEGGEYEPDMKPVFYSNAMKAVEGIKQEKATPEQWLKMIEKAGGLKAGEDKWIGLSDWLNDHKGKSLTKQEVLDYIRENQIQVEDVDYYDAHAGTPAGYGNSLREEAHDLANNTLAEEFAKNLEEGMSREDAEDRAWNTVKQRMLDEYGSGVMRYFGIHLNEDGEPEVYTTGTDRAFNDFADTVWHRKNGDSENAKEANTTRMSYTTDGLENKREIALTIPTIEPWNEDDEIHFGDAGEGRAVAWVRFGDAYLPSEEQKAASKAVDDFFDEMRAKYGVEKGDETSFLDKMSQEEIAEMQRLTAVEAEAKEKPGIKVLVIDEIQSKRHQEGREKGYGAPKEQLDKLRSRYEAKMKELEDYRKELEGKYGDEVLIGMDGKVTAEEYAKYQRLHNEANKAQGKLQDQYINYSNHPDAIPDAPFDKNWHEVMMKRMLRYAAENGYDKVAWTSGEQQAQRYDLSKSIKDITATGWTDYSALRGDEAKEAKLIAINTIDGGEYAQLLVDKNGKVLSDVDDQFVGRQLSDIVGKDLAKRLMEDGYQTIEGDGLRIGGEGMKGFYDQILPRFMDKYGKKWGVKTTDINLPNIGDNGLTMHSVDVTPEMKADVMEGQPMFFKTPEGEVYGFTLNGEIYIDPRYARPDTPIHEYTHLWAQALRDSNPTAWARLKEEMKGVDGGRLWDYVNSRYPELKNEDELVEEVFAHYSGKRGGERLEADMREEMAKADGVFGKAQVANIFHKLRELLNKFWTMARDLFAGKVEGVEKLSAEDFADMALGDMMNGFNPSGKRKEERGKRDAEYMAAVERGDMETEQRMVNEAAERAGYTIHAYHGTARKDRVGNVFRPERATSGPMAFFTDNRQIAQNYSTGKRDTSIGYDSDYDNYETQFRTKHKATGKDYAIWDMWGFLPLDVRAKLREQAGHVREDWEGDGGIIYDPDTKDGNGAFRGQVDEYHGNVLRALTYHWLKSGQLYNRESQFLDVLEKAGVNEALENLGFEMPRYLDPEYRDEGVYDVYLKMENPFDATKMVNEEFIKGFEEFAAEHEEEYEHESMSTDGWDKNDITAEDFADNMRRDLEDGHTNAWTAIPDVMTAYLKSLGYDGIKDTGGKGGGMSHTVYVPFSSEQVKSAAAETYDDAGNLIPLSKRFNDSKEDIRFQKSGTYTTRDGVQLSMMSLFEEGNVDNDVDNDHDLTNIRLRKLAPGEMCLVERRYEENKQFSFTGSEKIESMDDVAYIFKQLEDAAVENVFLALVKDGKPTVIHIGMGTYAQSSLDFRLALAAYKDIQPDAVYVVHNHPSGALKASKQDRNMLYNAKVFFGADVVKDGIIIDTVSGKYGVFGFVGERENAMPESADNEVSVKTYEFSKQVFNEDWNPEEATKFADSSDIAAFISSQRLGEHPKMSFIVVNNQYQVVGNYFLPWTSISEIDDFKAAADELSNYVQLSGGTSGILYGNYQYDNTTDKRNLQKLAAGMKSVGTPLSDVLHIDIHDELGYHSANDSEELTPEKEYEAPKREAGEDYLSYAKRIVEDRNAYEAIVKAYEAFNSGVSEVNDPGVEEILNDGSMGMREKITATAIKMANEQKDNMELRNAAVRAIGGNLMDIRKAMSLQREYDKGTVKRVADLARVLVKGGYLEGATNGEMSRILSIVKNATGKSDITGDIRKLMEIMVDSQLRRAEDMLNEVESIKGSKVDAKGVEVQGKLDVAGQQVMKTFKETRGYSEDELADALAEAENRMGSDDAAVAEEAANVRAGLILSLYYQQNIRSSKTEERKLRAELDDARHATDRSLEFENTLLEAIQQNRVERLDAYSELMNMLGETLQKSVDAAKEFNEADKERVREIQHNANSDMAGRPAKEHYKPKWKDKMANNSFVQFFFKPLATFDQMLRLFGSKSANGEGYLYNRFMRGWVDAREKEIRGVREKYAVLDEKVKSLFGGEAKNMADLIRLIGKMPKATVLFKNGGELVEHKLTQGNLMYIYMVNKMLDGRMKLRKMGIDENAINEVMRILDPRLMALADWMQEEFLVDSRNEYNETHKRIFGAPMAAIEHYFPLKINPNARVDKAEDLDDFYKNEGISTKTGSIIKRRRNALALDILNADALNVILDHVAKMEHWNAFAEFNRDLNTLRTYAHFRNQVKNMTTIYGSGDKLWEKFNDLCQMAAGTYRPKRADLDVAATNLAKGVTAAKVSFRIFTALKQFLSMPAYLPDARPDLWAKNLATPWKSWSWAMENLPIFEERWKSRMAGDPRLLKSELDWKGWRNNIVQLASKIGMSPNAFVDALTVSIGAKTIYESRKARYLKEGYSEEQAERKAKQDAEIAYNQTQQSSEGAFLSPMQVDRSWLSVMFTVFRNSSMAYQRQLHDALRNLKRDFKKGNREQSIEFMTKQMVRDGVDEEQAKEAATARYNRQVGKDALRVATFGFIMQFCWNLGAYLPYLLFGDDDDKKSDMWDDIFAKSMFGWGEGLTGGDVMSEAGKMAVKGEGNPEYLKKEMPLTSDAYKVLQEVGQGKYGEVVNDMVNLVVQAGIGVNPQSITDAVLAIMDACGDDPELAHEATIAVMRILQVPQSQIKEMYFDEVGLSGDEVSNYTPAQLAERYARYQVKRGRLLSPWTWDDKEVLKKKREAANKSIKERVDAIGGEELNEDYGKYEEQYKEYDAKLKDYKESGEYKNAAPYHKAELLTEYYKEDPQGYAEYVTFKDMDKILDKMVGYYLTSSTPQEAQACRNYIEEYKQAMVDVLGAESDEEKRAARENRNDCIKRFYDEVGNMQKTRTQEEKMQEENRKQTQKIREDESKSDAYLSK